MTPALSAEPSSELARSVEFFTDYYDRSRIPIPVVLGVFVLVFRVIFTRSFLALLLCVSNALWTCDRLPTKDRKYTYLNVERSSDSSFFIDQK